MFYYNCFCNFVTNNAEIIKIMCTISKEVIRRANARLVHGHASRIEGGISEGYIAITLHGKRFSQSLTNESVREAYGKALKHCGEE